MARTRRPPRRKARGPHLTRPARRRILAAALVLVTVGLLALPPRLTDRLRVWAAPVVAPLQDLTQGVALDLAEHLRSRASRDPATAEQVAVLRECVTVLEAELANMTARLDDARNRVRQIAGIREALEEMPVRLIPARIVAPEVAARSAGARLAKGADDGIGKGDTVVVGHLDRGARADLDAGQPVLTGAGLVGVVDAVAPWAATVRLTSDPRTRLMVQVIQRRDGRWLAGPEGLATGTPDARAIQLLHVGREHDVRVGDVVVTSPSPDSPVPPYLVVGTVKRVELKPAAVFHEIEVEPCVRPAEVVDVVVLAPAP